MNVAVTGSKGFIGSRLTEHLRKKGVDVFEFDEKKHDFFDVDSLKGFVADRDVIIHLAAVNRGTNKELIAGNVVLTHNLLAAAGKHNPRAKIIYSSSIQAKTDSVYGLSKRLAEELLEDHSREFGAPVTVFRIANVFGEGCRPFYNSVVATFCHQVARGETPTVNKEGKPIRLIYVGDVVKSISKEINAKRKNLFYAGDLSSGNLIKIHHLAKIIDSFDGGSLEKTPAGLEETFMNNLRRTYKWYVKNQNWPTNTWNQSK